MLNPDWSKEKKLADAGDNDIRAKLITEAIDEIAKFAFPSLQSHSRNDVAQEATAKAIRNWSSFKGTSEREFRGWLSAIAHRCLINYLRKRDGRSGQKAKLRSTTEVEQLVDDGSDESRPSRLVQTQEREEMIKRALQELSEEEERDLIEMRYIDGLTLNQIKTQYEIKTQLKRSEHFVNKTLAGAIVKLKGNLPNAEGIF